MFYGLSHFEDYFNDKISVFFALAPVTMVPNTKVEVIRFAAASYDLIDDTFSTLGIHSLLNNTWYNSTTT